MSNRNRERSMSLPAACHFNQQIAALSKQKQYDQAKQVFQSMIANGINPDVVTYNTMINLFVKSQQLSEAFNLFQTMKNQNIEPTIITFTSLIDGCGKCGDFEMAYNLYNQAKMEKVELNTHYFNAIINAAMLKNNVGIIDLILADMNTYGVQPNVVTFNTLISGYSKNGELKKLLALVKQMRKFGKEISQVGQLSLLNSASILLMTKEDVDIYCEIFRVSMFVLNENQTSICILELIKLKKLLIAHYLILQLIKDKHAIGTNSLSALAELAGYFANFDVLKWMNDYSNKHSINLKNVITYAQFNAYALFNNVQKVKAIFSQIISDYSSLPVSIKINAIQCLFSGNENELGLTIAENVINDYRLESEDADKLFQILYNREYYAESVELYNKLVKSTLIQFSTSCSDCIIRASIKTKINVDNLSYLRPSPPCLIQLVRVLPVEAVGRVPWSKMIESYRMPSQSSVLFELMNALLTKGLYNHAWTAFYHFVQLGVAPSENSIELAFQTQINSNNYENLSFLLDVVRESDVKPSAEFWSTILISALETGNLADAFSLKLEIESNNVELTPKASSLYFQIFDHITKSIPSINFNHQRKKTRFRSNTPPKPKTNHWNVMEEISYRSVLLALDE